MIQLHPRSIERFFSFIPLYYRISKCAVAHCNSVFHSAGKHYGAGGDVSGGAAPRSGVPPNTMTPGAAGSTAAVGPAQQQQYYQGYQSPPQFQG